VAFEFTKQGFGLYIAHFPTYTLVYGAFAAVPVFLLWIYVSWVVVLAGAVVVATLPEWRRQAVWGRLAPGMHFIYALQMLKLLWKARERGEGVTLAQMHNALNIGYERIEMLLGVMEQAGWVRRGDATGWGLYRDAHTITVAEIYRQFVFDPAVAADGKDEFAGTVQALGQGVDASSSAVVTLQALFTPPVGVETGESQKD
jgi:membrane protein